MKSSFLVSVMHTGTTWLNDYVRPSDGFHHVHAHIEDMVLSHCRKADVIVSPLRHPQSVWKSFIWRAEPLAYFWDGWRHLDQLDREFDIHYVPVDLPDVRDRCLDEVCEAIGMERSPTTWEPVGMWEKSRTYVPDRDLSEVMAMPMVARFYQ